MSLLLKTIGYYLLGTLFLIFQGIAVIFAGVYRLWEYFRYQVQCLRYPPPPGGMYGAYRNRPDTPNTLDK